MAQPERFTTVYSTGLLDSSDTGDFPLYPATDWVIATVSAAGCWFVGYCVAIKTGDTYPIIYFTNGAPTVAGDALTSANIWGVQVRKGSGTDIRAKWSSEYFPHPITCQNGLYCLHDGVATAEAIYINILYAR